MSRRQASRQWNGNQVKQVLASQGILIRSSSMRWLAEEEPGVVDMETLLKAVSGRYTLIDITTQEADLEEIFLTYYEDEEVTT